MEWKAPHAAHPPYNRAIKAQRRRPGGEGEIVVHSPESYTMKMSVTQKGQKDRMTMEAQGKFISSDCGSLKPLK